MVSSFLLVTLNIDAILDEVTLYQRRKKLDEMTKGEGLGDAYEAIFSRMRAQSRSRSKLGMEVLMWYRMRNDHYMSTSYAMPSG